MCLIGVSNSNMFHFFFFYKYRMCIAIIFNPISGLFNLKIFD